MDTKTEVTPLDEVLKATTEILESCKYDSARKVKDPRLRKRYDANLKFWTAMYTHLTNYQKSLK